jgi:hypothetical protein
MSDHIMISCRYDLGDDLLKVIGEIVVSFGQLEHAVALSIKRTSPATTLTDVQAFTDILVGRSRRAQESFEVWAKDQDREGDFKRLTDQVGDIARRRRDVVHALWGKDRDGGVRWLRNGQERDIEIAQLELLRDDIRQLTAEINHATRPDLVTIDTTELSALPTSFD